MWPHKNKIKSNWHVDISINIYDTTKKQLFLMQNTFLVMIIVMPSCFLMKSVCTVIQSRQKSPSHRAKWQATMQKKIEILQKTHLHSAFLWTTHKKVTKHVISHSNESKMTCSQKKKKPKRLNLNFAQSLCSHTT